MRMTASVGASVALPLCACPNLGNRPLSHRRNNFYSLYRSSGLVFLFLADYEYFFSRDLFSSYFLPISALPWCV